jgi:hypothetical protein
VSEQTAAQPSVSLAKSDKAEEAAGAGRKIQVPKGTGGSYDGTPAVLVAVAGGVTVHTAERPAGTGVSLRAVRRRPLGKTVRLIGLDGTVHKASLDKPELDHLDAPVEAAADTGSTQKARKKKGEGIGLFSSGPIFFLVVGSLIVLLCVFVLAWLAYDRLRDAGVAKRFVARLNELGVGSE